MDEGKDVSPEDQQRLLDSSELEQNQHSHPRRKLRRYDSVRLVTILTTGAIALTVGVFVGLLLRPSNSRHGLLYPPGNTEQYFQHNQTFTHKPDDESEAAWASIFPVGRGFIHHEEIAPFISSVSVFHQLHCLHAMIVAYYDALEAPSLVNGTVPPDWDDPTLTRIAIPHIRHCYDYLRQSIMCASDTNLEDLDHETRKTSGWGQQKKCRDYNAVFAWVEKYANSTETGIVT